MYASLAPHYIKNPIEEKQLFSNNVFKHEEILGFSCEVIQTITRTIVGTIQLSTPSKTYIFHIGAYDHEDNVEESDTDSNSNGEENLMNDYDRVHVTNTLSTAQENELTFEENNAARSRKLISKELRYILESNDVFKVGINIINQFNSLCEAIDLQYNRKAILEVDENSCLDIISTYNRKNLIHTPMKNPRDVAITATKLRNLRKKCEDIDWEEQFPLHNEHKQYLSLSACYPLYLFVKTTSIKTIDVTFLSRTTLYQQFAQQTNITKTTTNTNFLSVHSPTKSVLLLQFWRFDIQDIIHPTIMSAYGILPLLPLATMNTYICLHEYDMDCQSVAEFRHIDYNTLCNRFRSIIENGYEYNWINITDKLNHVIDFDVTSQSEPTKRQSNLNKLGDQQHNGINNSSKNTQQTSVWSIDGAPTIQNSQPTSVWSIDDERKEHESPGNAYSNSSLNSVTNNNNNNTKKHKHENILHLQVKLIDHISTEFSTKSKSQEHKVIVNTLRSIYYKTSTIKTTLELNEVMDHAFSLIDITTFIDQGYQPYASLVHMIVKHIKRFLWTRLVSRMNIVMHDYTL